MTLFIPLTPAGRAVDDRLSANELFKQNYPRYLRWSVLAALALTALLVALMPRYEPLPYVLRSNELELVIIAEAPPVPPPEKPRAAPVMPKVIQPVADPSVDDYVPPTLIEPEPPFVRFEGPYDDTGFVASSTNPVLRFQAKADYPLIARRSGLAGTVIVKVLVGVEGRVEAAEVIQPVHPLLDREALVAAARCRFEPAKQRQLKVRAWVALPYRFKLR